MALLKAHTSYGIVSGKPGDSNAAISDFLGIPYAKPPVGELRFMAPQDPEPWAGEINCTSFGHACIQQQHPNDTSPADFSEDCLYLNVYTPADSAEEKLPVLFWIYGGGFSGGSSANPEMIGERLCEKGVLVVTINYRCGALGFFSLPELEQKEGGGLNAGILDEIAALKWVQQNISAFGGDPERVTVFGQSAGGMSTRMLLTSPLTDGLFSRAIVQSGGGLNEADPVRTRADFTAVCQTVLDHLGWSPEDILAKDAMEVNTTLMNTARKILPGQEVGYFQPFIDGYSILDVPGKLISQGRYHDIPVICGTVAGDSWMFSRKVVDRLTDEKYLRGFSYVASQAWANLNVKSGRTPIYTYYMDRIQPPRPMRGTHGAAHFGSTTPHSSDVPYIFRTLSAKDDRFTGYDEELSDLMSTYWTNFAKTGSPNGAGLPQWPLYTEQTPVAMHFGNDHSAAEEIVLSDEEWNTITYTQEHPGLLTSLEGFHKINEGSL